MYKYLTTLLLFFFTNVVYAWETNATVGVYTYSYTIDSCTESGTANNYCATAQFNDDQQTMFGITGFSDNDGLSYGYDVMFGKHTQVFANLRYTLTDVGIIVGYGGILLTDPPIAKHGGRNAAHDNSDSIAYGVKLGVDFALDKKNAITFFYQQAEFDTRQVFPEADASTFVNAGIENATVEVVSMSLNWQHKF